MQHSDYIHYGQHNLVPAEEAVETLKHERHISIGIPAGRSKDDSCVPLTPQAVELLVGQGISVYVESGAGVNARYTDLQYSEAGATISDKKSDVFQCDFLLKAETYSEEDIDLMRKGQVVFSMLQIGKHSEKSIRMMMAKKITAIAFEYMSDEMGEQIVMQSMSEIAGAAAITVAGELLSTTSGGKGVLLGGVTGISPASLIIMGAGSAAEYAARAALGFGAEVKIFDSSVARLRAFEKKFGHKLFTSIYYPRVIKKAIGSADVVIAAQPFNAIPEYRISSELIKKMKRGSIIIDLNICQGGSFETSHYTTLDDPTFEEFDVVHYCVPNITARVPRTASIALSNVFAPIFLEMDQYGGISNYTKFCKSFRGGVYIYNGILVNKDISMKFNIPSKDIDLLLAVF